MIPKSQIPQIKKQLIRQIKATFPKDKQALAIKQLKSMSDEQFEQFLIQNKLIQISENQSSQNSPPQDSPAPSPAQQCIFCSIINQQIPSYKIDENKDSIAVLEINPISKAHVLIVPKEHIKSSEKLPPTAFTLAKKIAKKIKTKFKPKEVKIYSENLFGHEILNVLPIHENEAPDSQRTKAQEKELKQLQEKLKTKPRKKPVKKTSLKKDSKKQKIWLPKRIP